MSSLFEQTFVLVLRIANGILEGRSDTRASAAALTAQADQVAAELREAEARFDETPGHAGLSRILGARAAFCSQVACERLLETFVQRGQLGVPRAIETFDLTANTIVRYLNAEADGDEVGAIEAVEDACSMLPPGRREMLSL